MSNVHPRTSLPLFYFALAVAIAVLVVGYLEGDFSWVIGVQITVAILVAYSLGKHRERSGYAPELDQE